MLVLPLHDKHNRKGFDCGEVESLQPRLTTSPATSCPSDFFNRHPNGHDKTDFTPCSGRILEWAVSLNSSPLLKLLKPLKVAVILVGQGLWR